MSTSEHFEREDFRAEPPVSTEGNVESAARDPAAEPMVAQGAWLDRVAPCVTEWFSTPPPRRSWLLRDSRANDSGVLPRGKVGLVLAEGGAGKTMALCQLALAVASHEPAPWVGCFTVPEQGRVLLLLGEEDADEVRRRLYNARRATGAPLPEPRSIIVVPLAGLPCPMVEADDRGLPIDAPFLTWVRAYMKDAGPFALVIVDPLSRFAGLDAEVDNAAATRFVQALESIASDSGATVVVAHHTNKLARGGGARMSGASARGSSAIVDGVRWAAALSSERLEASDGDHPELVTLSIVKSNYARKAAPVTLRRDSDNGGALVPISEAERERASQAAADATPAVRRQSERDDQARARTSKVAAAIRAALISVPAGLSFRALRGKVRAGLGQCSDQSLDAALAELGEQIVTRDGPRGATIHTLVERKAA